MVKGVCMGEVSGLSSESIKLYLPIIIIILSSLLQNSFKMLLLLQNSFEML